jgi:subfamily B ATP-binding cassette protein MsbA
MQFLRKIAKLTKPYWPRVFSGIVLGLMLTGITGAIAWLAKAAVDDVLVEKHYEYLKYVPPGIILLFLIKGLLSFGQAYLMKSAGMKLTREMRNSIYNHILNLPVEYFNRKSSGVIISKVINDVKVLNKLVSNVITTFVMEVPTVFILLGIALYRRWDLTLMTLILFPFIAYSTKKFGKRVKKKRKEAQRRISFVTHKVGEAIQGIRIIKVFNRESTMQNKFKRQNQNHYREMLRVLRLKEFTKLLVDVSTGIGIAVTMWYGFTLVSNGNITPGDLASILIAISMIFSPIKKISDAYNVLQETKASLERIDEVFDIKHEGHGKLSLDGFKESLIFNNVSFAYQGSDSLVLKDVNLKISQGEVLAFVGKSGVGKSTLVDLIPRFSKPLKAKTLYCSMTLSGKTLPLAGSMHLKMILSRRPDWHMLMNL